MRSPILCCALFATFLSSAPATAQDSSRYDALLWRISGGDLTRPSYVYGTMHVSNKVAFHLTEEFFAALEGADAVALEVDPGTWLPDLCRSKVFLELSRFGGASSNTDLYNTAFTFTPPGREEITSLLASDPEAVNNLLFRMSASGTDHEESTYLDLFIFQSARKLGKPVMGLEKLDDALGNYLKAILPDPEGDKEAQAAAKRTKPDAVENAQQLMEDAYRSQDLLRMDTLFDQLLPMPNARKYLLDARNEVFVAHMVEAMHRGTLFTGIGAAHLAGTKGVIAMLRARGYTVEPVHGHASERSKARREKLDRTDLPLAFAQYNTTDSLFTMDLPGPLCELPANLTRGLHTELCVDNVNGAFYSVQRLPTYAGLRGISQEEVLQQVDSFLYEAIPGRIDRRVRFTADNGWPAIELRSTTAKGRQVHYRILAGPFDLFVFKRSTKGGAQAEKQGQKAFTSIRSTPARTLPGRWTPQRATCSVATAPLRSVEDLPATFSIKPCSQRIAVARSMDPRTGAQYLFAAASYPDVDHIEQDTFELHVLAERFVKELGGTGIVHRDTTVAGLPACVSTCTGQRGGTLRTMTALQGPVYFLLACRGTAEESNAYFASFRPEQEHVAGTLTPYRDPTLEFSVRTAATMQSAQDFINAMGDGMIERLIGMERAGTSAHEQRREDLTYTSTVSGHAVNVVRWKFHRFAEETDSVKTWDDWTKQLNGQGNYRVSRCVRSGPPDARTLDLLLTDTASSRGIRVRTILRPDAVYTLRACVDSVDASPPWLDAFFATFTPTDTPRYEGLFMPKGDVFMAWLTGSDTAQARQARDSFGTVKLTDRHAPALVAYLGSDASKDLKEEERKAAVENLAGLHHASVLPYLKRMHDNAGDTLELRLIALHAMAEQHTPQATELFKRTMLAKPPLASEDWRVQHVFDPFYDSLPTAAALFPDIERLARYPELESAVRHLKAALTDRKALPMASAPATEQLLMDAEAELQRVVSADRRSAEGNGGTRYGNDEDDNNNTLYIPSGKDKVTPWSFDLTTHLRLLMPLYDRPEVHAFYDKALATGVDGVVVETGLLLMDRGRTVDPAVWGKLADRNDLRAWLYRTGAELGHPELVPADKLDPQRNADATMMEDWKDAQKDSVTFIGTRETRCFYGTGTVYFYRSLARDSDGKATGEWYVCYTGIHPGAKGPFPNNVRGWVEQTRTLGELDKGVDDAMRKLRYLGRPRWSKTTE